MLKQIFAYELKSSAKNAANYLYFLAFFGIALLAMLGSGGFFDAPPPDAASPPPFLNSPYALLSIFQYFNKFFMFLLPAIIGNSLYQDYKSRMHPILYSYPIRKLDYLAGKFLSAFTVVVILCLSVGLALMLGEAVLGADNPRIGPFRPLAYLSIYLIFTLPNMLIYGLLVFAIVGLSRNIYTGFVIVLILFCLQITIENVLAGYPYLQALIDPFAQSTVNYTAGFWTIAEQNERRLPISDLVRYNRLLWLSIAGIISVLFYRRFALEQDAVSLRSLGRFSRKKDIKPSLTSSEKSALNELEISYDPSIWKQIRSLYQLSVMESRSIYGKAMFWLLLSFGILAVVFALGRVTDQADFRLLPLTRIMLSVPTFFFSAIIMLMTFLYAGLLVHRDRVANMQQLVDVTPTANWVLWGSKLLALIQIQIGLLLVMMCCGLSLQLYHGYDHFEIGLYLFHLFIITLPPLMIWAVLAMAVHSLLSNLYIGIFLLLLVWIGKDQGAQLGLTSYLVRFNSTPPLLYSDMNGYGHGLPATYLINAYWMAFSGILTVVIHVLWRRGFVDTWKERLQLARHRSSRAVLIGLSGCILLFLLLGAQIFQSENQLLEASVTPEDLKKRYQVYRDAPQPKIHSIKLAIDLYPHNRSFQAKGSYQLVNAGAGPIRFLLVKTGYDEITDYAIQAAHTPVSRDTQWQFTVHRLEEPLAPGDSIEFSFQIQNKPNSLLERQSGVLQNGTFLRTDILPRFGYFLDRATRHPTDSLASRENFYADDADLVDLDVMISTSADQTALAPGTLIRNWETSGRNHFHYRTKEKIKFAAAFSSGRYERQEDQYRGIDLEVYFHPEHPYTVESVIAGLKAALDYNIDYFGSYQHPEIRVVEFPLSEGTYATAMANGIAMSEQRFVINSETEKKGIDLSFYIAAHELTHQWWGNQVVPGNARGATMLTESITEYISLNLYEQHYGREPAQRFLQLQRERYLRGRSRDSAAEVPLFLVTSEQEHIAYGKGTIAFHCLKHYLGEEQLNALLQTFLAQFRFRTDLYPTTLQLIDLLKKNTPMELQYLVEDYFETVTFWETEIEAAGVKPDPSGAHEVKVRFSIDKYRVATDRKELPLKDYLEIGFLRADHSLIATRTVFTDSSQNEFSFTLEERPDRVVLDPHLLLLEQNIADNTLKISD